MGRTCSLLGELGEPTFLDVPQGLRGTDVQFFTLPWLQFSLSNGVKHASVLRSSGKKKKEKEKGRRASVRSTAGL